MTASRFPRLPYTWFGGVSSRIWRRVKASLWKHTRPPHKICGTKTEQKNQSIILKNTKNTHKIYMFVRVFFSLAARRRFISKRMKFKSKYFNSNLRRECVCEQSMGKEQSIKFLYENIFFSLFLHCMCFSVMKYVCGCSY